MSDTIKFRPAQPMNDTDISYEVDSPFGLLIAHFWHEDGKHRHGGLRASLEFPWRGGYQRTPGVINGVEVTGHIDLCLDNEMDSGDVTLTRAATYGHNNATAAGKRKFREYGVSVLRFLAEKVDPKPEAKRRDLERRAQTLREELTRKREELRKLEIELGAICEEL